MRRIITLCLILCLCAGAWGEVDYKVNYEKVIEFKTVKFIVINTGNCEIVHYRWGLRELTPIDMLKLRDWISEVYGEKQYTSTNYKTMLDACIDNVKNELENPQ